MHSLQELHLSSADPFSAYTPSVKSSSVDLSSVDLSSVDSSSADSSSGNVRGRKSCCTRPERITERPWLVSGGSPRKRVHIAGLGDVGRNVALGLRLLGGEVISSIGVFDLNRFQCLRLEMELNQILPPDPARPMPAVDLIDAEELFDCDLFLFTATKSVPKVEAAPEKTGKTGKGNSDQMPDVRMAQFEANRRIVADYAARAAESGFKGLFVVISDPVDLLCMEALRGCAGIGAAWTETGHAAPTAGKALSPEQIMGCGLGVMYARAAYYAERLDAGDKTAAFRIEGRAFGPHGKDLVIANSLDPDRYDDSLSREITGLAVRSNLETRKLGFKPFLAPAMSSAVFSLLAMMRGEWHYSARYLNGLYFGAKNRETPEGVQWEDAGLPDALFSRLQESYRNLEKILFQSDKYLSRGYDK